MNMHMQWYQWIQTLLLVVLPPLRVVEFVCNSLKSLWLISWLIHLFSCRIWVILLHIEDNTMQNTCALIVSRLMGFTATNYAGVDSFFPSACFIPTAVYLPSVDGAYLNNQPHICMYPSHLYMWRATRLLIIPVDCLFMLTSLGVLFSMRRVLDSLVFAAWRSHLLLYICGVSSKEA